MISTDTPKLSLKMRYRAYKTEKELKNKGFHNLERKVNKKGECAILGWKTPDKDELVVSALIKPDGSSSISQYKLYTNEETGYKAKVIYTWDKVKDSYVFNKVTEFFYGKAKAPEMIKTMYSDKDSWDGVEFDYKYPLKKLEEKAAGIF